MMHALRIYLVIGILGWVAPLPASDLIVGGYPRVVRLDETGQSQTIASDYIHEGQFDYGYTDATFGPDGRLYTVVKNRIDRFDGTTYQFDGNFIQGMPGDSDTHPYYRTMVFGPNGDLYVAGGVFTSLSEDGFDRDAGIDRVFRFDSNGQSAGVFISPIANSFILDMAFGPNGDLYLADSLNHNVSRYDSNGSFLGALAFPDPVDAFDLTPNALSFGPDGNLYVSYHGGVHRFDGVNQNYLGLFVEPGSLPAEGILNSPRGLAFGSDGLLYIAAADHSIVRVNSLTGEYVDVFTTLIDNPDHLEFAPVPETSSIVLMGLGAVALLIQLRRKSVRI